MSATLESFFPWVLPWVPGCPDPLADQAIRDACIDFCTRTDLVTRIQPMDITATQQDYIVVPPTDMDFTRVISVWWQGKKLLPLPPTLVDSDVALRGVAIGNAVPQTGDPKWFFQKTPTDLGFSLYPIPDTTLVGGLTVKVSFQPSNTAATVESILWENYSNDIACGALATLMGMPGQQFTSPLAKEYSVRFEAAIIVGHNQAQFGKLPAAMRVQAQRFV